MMRSSIPNADHRDQIKDTRLPSHKSTAKIQFARRFLGFVRKSASNHEKLKKEFKEPQGITEFKKERNLGFVIKKNK